MNTITVSGKLTNRIKQSDSMVKRICDYEYYDGRSKTMAPAYYTVIGFGKKGEELAKLPEGTEVVIEGSMQLLVKERDGGGKDRVLEIDMSRYHVLSK